MSSSSSTRSGGGIGFVGMLTILFIGLKLAKVIDWSWVWVLSPLWISVGIVLAIVLISFTVYGIIKLIIATLRSKQHHGRN